MVLVLVLVVELELELESVLVVVVLVFSIGIGSIRLAEMTGLALPVALVWRLVEMRGLLNLLLIPILKPAGP